MTAREIPIAPAARPTAPNRRTGLVLAVATAAAIAAGAGLLAALSGKADDTVEAAAPPAAGVVTAAEPHPPVDHGSVNWDEVPVEPDPSPRSVAAYGVWP